MAHKRTRIDDGGPAFAGGMSLRDHAALEFAKMIYAAKGRQFIEDEISHGESSGSVGLRVAFNAYQMADEFILRKRETERWGKPFRNNPAIEESRS